MNGGHLSARPGDQLPISSGSDAAALPIADRPCGHADWCFDVVDGERVCRECERVAVLKVQYGDGLLALEKRGDELVRFHENIEQARTWMEENGTDKLVEELRHAQRHRQPMRLGTINTLILLAHIDRLEAAVANEPLVKP